MTYPATYWTGVWDPAREAISKEVATLRAALAPGSPVVSLAAGQASGWLRHDRVLRLRGDRWLTYRAAAALLERRGRVTHVFGELGAWHPLRALGRRPLVFTVVVPGTIPAPALLDAVTLFAPETPALATALQEAGVEAERIRIIPPGVDLEHFAPRPVPPGRFTLLFASSPSRVTDIAPRGIGLLVDLARAVPDIDVVLLWRQWGELAASREALRALHLPPNVRVQQADLPDPRHAYWGAHAVVCAFAEGHGKSCPNSVIEALACGRPALLTDTVGVASVIAQEGGGTVCARSVAGLVDGLMRIRSGGAALAREARTVALNRFDRTTWVQAYRAAYDAAGRAAR